MVTFEEAVKNWTEIINDWYDLDASTDEVGHSFAHCFRDRTTFDDDDVGASSHRLAKSMACHDNRTGGNNLVDTGV